MGIPEDSRRQGKVERYCCKVTYCAPTTVKVKGLRRDERLSVAGYRPSISFVGNCKCS